jgi:cyclopropane-fatty-acyl-phospholipid synthase
VRFADGSEHHTGRDPQFTIAIASPAAFEALLRRSAAGAALRFLRGDYDITGDLVAAIQFWEQQWERRWFTPVLRIAGRVLSKRPESWFQTRARARQNILFHYDRSNDFYRLFLDRRMVYSCAYFEHAGDPLDHAQLAKLDHICRKLEIGPGTRFLDIGSGWGALVLRAAEWFGADATGCTLSDRQYEESQEAGRSSAASSRVTFFNRDYRELNGRFDAVASVGMFEHVGRHRLRGYFQKIASLLEDEGRFLNHGIVRASGVADDPSTRFIQRRVFPGGELTTIEHVLETAERAGLEPIDVENLRPHYALTCRAWIRRLEEQRDACVRLVGEETYRTWRLYLAGSARNFEAGNLGVFQVLFARRGAPRRRLTREYIYTGANRC